MSDPTESTHGGTSELVWTNEEKKVLEGRILSLRDDQLGALLEIAGLGFHKGDLPSVIHDIKKDGLHSGHLEILLAEANSKETLLWWIAFFEQSNEVLAA